MTINHFLNLIKRVEPVEKIAFSNFFTIKIIIRIRNKIFEKAKIDKISLIFWTNMFKFDKGHVSTTEYLKNKLVG